MGMFTYHTGFDVSLNIEGAHLIEAYLKEISDDICRKRMVKALRRAAKVIEGITIATAPVSPHGRGPGKTYPAHGPGNLRDSITIQSARRNRTADTLVVHVGMTKDAFYWRWVEFGHVGKGGKDVPAYPFLRPAMDSGSTEAFNAAGKYLRNSMKRYRTKQTKGKA